MKINIYPIVWLLVCCMACEKPGGTETRQPVAGRYVRQINQAFIKGADTLYIVAVGDDPNTFAVVRHLWLQKVLHGKQRPAEASTVIWQAVYKEKKNRLFDEKTGNTWLFDSLRGKLFFGSRVFKRLQ